MSEQKNGKKASLAVAAMDDLPPRIGTGYPSPFDQPCQKRSKTALGDAVGLTQFGVNLLQLPPGSWSAQRHWHHNEDEFILVLEGEVTLVSDEGKRLLGPGDIAGFPAGQANGHHLVNDSDEHVRVLEIGTRAENETAIYPDVDLKAVGAGGKYRFLHKNDEPYE